MRKYFYGLIILSLCAGLMFSVYGCGGSGAGGPLGGINNNNVDTGGATITSVVDQDGDNRSTDNNEEEIFFRAKGQNFGLTQGVVRFINVKDGAIIEAEILTWSDGQVVGQVTIPAGKYLVEVVTEDGTGTTQDVFYLKGTGSFPVTAQ